jgi:hypothetical protein
MRRMLAFPLLFAPFIVGQRGGQRGGSLDGKVVNPNTGQPVAGVDIVLYTQSGARVRVEQSPVEGIELTAAPWLQ